MKSAFRVLLNPNTKIRFDIPLIGNAETQQVDVKIYDILGCEIATLVDNKMKPGSYEITFNGTNYPSGVYFYKIEAGSFVQSRKMVLIK